MAQPWRRFVEAGYATRDPFAYRSTFAPIKSEMADTRGFACAGRLRALLGPPPQAKAPRSCDGALICYSATRIKAVLI
jgi:hypothetical protein